MKKRITLKHIAGKFDVSIATVSKALHDSYEISVKTKEKIQEYARAHNYKPNNIALSLINKKTKLCSVQTRLYYSIWVIHSPKRLNLC